MSPTSAARPPRPLARPRRPGDDGQASPLVAVVLLLAAAVVVGLVGAASVVVDGARARTAADAAALAGAAEGEPAARAQARANGGRVVTYVVEGDDVVVVAEVGRARASARARREGTWCRSVPGEGGAGGPISYTEPPCPSIPG